MDLVSCVKGILLNPKGEWAAIDAESTTSSALYAGYVVPLAALAAICGFIGASIIGSPLVGKTGMMSGLIGAVIGLGFTLVTVFLMSLIINALAPTFGGEKSPIQALKVAAYSSTALWISGVFALVPGIGGLIRLVGLCYSLFLLYVGLPILMKSPEDRSGGYAVVVIIAWVLLYIVIGIVFASVMVAALGAGVMMGH